MPSSSSAEIAGPLGALFHSMGDTGFSGAQGAAELLSGECSLQMLPRWSPQLCGSKEPPVKGSGVFL